MTATSTMIALRDRFAAYNHQSLPEGTLPFVLNGHRCGQMVPEVQRKLHASPFESRFEFGDTCISLRVDSQSALHELVQQMHAHGLFYQWRNEWLDVRNSDGAIVMRAERGVFRFFGMTTHAAYAVGYAHDERIWCGLRSRTKQVDPGLWDVLTAGMMASGESVDVALERELMEEAGLVAARDTQAMGEDFALDVMRVVHEGWMHEVAHVRALRVRPEAHVHNTDGEVERFACLTQAEVLAWMEQSRMPTDTAWVTLEVMLRRAGVQP